MRYNYTIPHCKWITNHLRILSTMLLLALVASPDSSAQIANAPANISSPWITATYPNLTVTSRRSGVITESNNFSNKVRLIDTDTDNSQYRKSLWRCHRVTLCQADGM